MGRPSQIMEKKSVLCQKYDDIRTNDSIDSHITIYTLHRYIPICNLVSVWKECFDWILCGFWLPVRYCGWCAACSWCAVCRLLHIVWWIKPVRGQIHNQLQLRQITRHIITNVLTITISNLCITINNSQSIILKICFHNQLQYKPHKNSILIFFWTFLSFWILLY